MTIVAITGDGTTTLTLALAAALRRRDRRRDRSDVGRPLVGDVLVVEADERGGALAGWLDTPVHPSIATIAAAIGRGEPAQETVRSMAHRTASGLRVITAPVRRAAATRALAELPSEALDALGTTVDPVLVDLGTPSPEPGPAAFTRRAAVVVLAHRQRGDTARAESVRLERLAESAEWLATLGTPIHLAVTGSDPFDPDEISRFVDDTINGDLAAIHTLPDDRLTAAVLAGRTGVSARRLARLPLMRAAGELAAAMIVAEPGLATAGTNPGADT